VTVRDLSISAGLEAVTFTPGMIAPEGSLTTPAILLCAETNRGKNTKSAAARYEASFDFVIPLSPFDRISALKPIEQAESISADPRTSGTELRYHSQPVAR
jgi:hypothetical protein